MVRNPVSSYEFPVIGSIAALATLLAAYWVFDSAMAQKSIFKMQQQGEYKIRYAFPVLPGIVIQDPSYIQTKHGNKLLTDGWWQYARKINYTADWIQSCMWAVSGGFVTPITYFYPAFFLAVLTHRCGRDFEKCARKYGEDWEEYCKVVKYKFIPGIY
jgi:delta24(24(1))-sterol reductase